tara:strand:+ start:5255 stop:6166 length:912 start_codon:yes stop_codon:yes gene_type:complete
MLIIKQLGLVLEPSSAFITSLVKTGKCYTYTIGDANQTIDQSGNKEDLSNQWLKYSQLIYPEPKQPKRTLIVDIVASILDPHRDEIRSRIGDSLDSVTNIAKRYNLTNHHISRWMTVNNIVLPKEMKIDPEIQILLDSNKDKIIKMLNIGCDMITVNEVLGYKKNITRNLYSFTRTNRIFKQYNNSRQVKIFEGCSIKELLMINKTRLNMHIRYGHSRKIICEDLNISQASLCIALKDRSIGINNIPRPKSTQQIQSQEIDKKLHKSKLRIRDMRSKGLGQREIAELLGVSQSKLSGWLRKTK